MQTFKSLTKVKCEIQLAVQYNKEVDFQVYLPLKALITFNDKTKTYVTFDLVASKLPVTSDAVNNFANLTDYNFELQASM